MQQIDLLEGTAAHDTIIEARQVRLYCWLASKCMSTVQNICIMTRNCTGCLQHVRAQYQAALPAMQALLAAYPQHITAEQLSEESFLWACDIWYSYAMEASVELLPLAPPSMLNVTGTHARVLQSSQASAWHALHARTLAPKLQQLSMP